jgi:hypothetical protein
MSRAAYISLLVYIPVLIFFMLYTADSRLADWAWFTVDKAVLLVLLLALRDREIIPTRRRLLAGFAMAIGVYIVYLGFDAFGNYRNNIYIVSALSVVYILSIIYSLKNDR